MITKKTYLEKTIKNILLKDISEKILLTMHIYYQR